MTWEKEVELEGSMLGLYRLGTDSAAGIATG